MTDDRRDLAWLGVAALVLVSVDLGARVFVSNDEARFPLLARDVLAHAHWLAPTVDGAPYYNKPALLAWLIAAVSWPLGHVTQLTAVVPSAAAGIGTALVTYAIGRELFDAEVGRLAALVAMTTQGLFLHARLALPDMLMTFFTAVSLWMLARWLRTRSRACWLGAYGFTAAAFWAKGLAGLLPLAVIVGFRVLDRRSRRASDFRVWPGLALVAALVAPWWLAGLVSQRAAMTETVVVDNVLWYLPRTPSLRALAAPFQHVFGILFPWVFVVPVAVWAAVKSRGEGGAMRAGVLLLLLWAAIVVALVGVSHQQRFRYYVPLVPPASLLIGWWARSAAVMRRGLAPGRWRVAAGVVAALAAAAAGALALADQGAGAHRWVLDAGLAAVAVSVLAGAVSYGWRGARTVFTVAWLATAALFVVGYHEVVARDNRANDYPGFFATVKPALSAAPVVAAWGVPALPLRFYLEAPAVPVDSAEDLRRALGAHPKAVALVPAGAAAALSDRDQLTILGRGVLAGKAVVVVGREPSDAR